MTKSEAAFRFSADRLAEMGKIYFWTFTFVEVLDLVDTRRRWNYLLTLIRRKWPKACGLRVFELHQSHGLHVHLIANKFIHVNALRKLARQAGWGRIHVKRITKEDTGYLAKYLSKERPKGLKGWRLWAAFGETWQWTKVGDIEIDSLYSRVYRGLAEAFRWTGNKNFKEKSKLAHRISLLTIEQGWEPGFGPDGRTYDQCSHQELSDPEGRKRKFSQKIASKK